VKGKMSALEAFLLGMYLVGMRWVCKCHGTEDAYAVASEKEPIKRSWGCGWYYGSNGSWFYDLEGDPNEPILFDELSSHDGLIEILPWLTAHGITPPEVEE
jgi:hypothetical protein